MTVQEALELLNTYLQDHRDQRRFTLDMDPMKGVDLAVEFIAISSAFRHAEDYENSQLIFIAQSILDDYFSQKWAEENDPEEIAKKAQQPAPQVQQPQQQPAPPVVERPQAPQQQAPARPQAQPAAQRGIPLSRLPLGQLADPAAAEVYRAIHGASYRAPAAPSYQAAPAAPAPKAKKTKQEKPAAPKKEKKHKQEKPAAPKKEHKPSIWNRIFHREQPEEVPSSPPREQAQPAVLIAFPTSTPSYATVMEDENVLLLRQIGYDISELPELLESLDIINAVPTEWKQHGHVLTLRTNPEIAFQILNAATDYVRNPEMQVSMVPRSEVFGAAGGYLRPYFSHLKKFMQNKTPAPRIAMLY